MRSVGDSQSTRRCVFDGGRGREDQFAVLHQGQKNTEDLVLRDLSYVKVGKKTPLTLAHFGFDANGGVLADAQLPAILTDDWHADEANANKPFPSYARMQQQHGKPGGESRYSWTLDFAARRAKARAEMQPWHDEAAQIKAAIVDLKEQLKRGHPHAAADHQQYRGAGTYRCGRVGAFECANAASEMSE